MDRPDWRRSTAPRSRASYEPIIASRRRQQHGLPDVRIWVGDYSRLGLALGPEIGTSAVSHRDLFWQDIWQMVANETHYLFVHGQEAEAARSAENLALNGLRIRFRVRVSPREHIYFGGLDPPSNRRVVSS
jgi:hypothetical protein